MATYVSTNDTLLIVRLISTDGTPVNLYLDKRCIYGCSCEPP